MSNIGLKEIYCYNCDKIIYRCDSISRLKEVEEEHKKEFKTHRTVIQRYYHH